VQQTLPVPPKLLAQQQEHWLQPLHSLVLQQPLQWLAHLPWLGH
jgi:hypothetical protein